MKKLLLLFLFLCSLEVAQAQPGISTAIRSEEHTSELQSLQ